MVPVVDRLHSKRIRSPVEAMTSQDFPPWTRDSDDDEDGESEPWSNQPASRRPSASSSRHRSVSPDGSQASSSKRNDIDLTDHDSSSDDEWDSDDDLHDILVPSDWVSPVMPSLPASPIASPETPTLNLTIRPVIQSPDNEYYQTSSLASLTSLPYGPDMTASMSILPVTSTTATLETSLSVPRKGKTLIEPPSPTATSPLVSLTPIVTGSLPPITTGARKEVDVPVPDHYDDPDDIPILTITESAAPTPTPATSALPVSPPDPDTVVLHAGLLPKTERALIAVGSVGATIIVFFVCWLVWKCVKMHKRGNQSTSWRDKAPSALSLQGIKRGMGNLASRTPFLKNRVQRRNWANLDKPADDAFWEKRLPSSPTQQEESRGMRMHTAMARQSRLGHAEALGVVDGASSPTQLPYNLTMSSTQPQDGPQHRSSRITSVSEMSSLSSGFGDGDIMIPSMNKGPATTVASVTAPPPVAQRASISSFFHRRETVYTEASEDPIPRFRSINSWVRQQSGRVKRAKQREQTDSDAPPVPSMPPEQDFRLMMPDEEEPRRVENESKTFES
ncbi:hypothetical protein CDD82_4498 [Ophiocordyceps australis]|uniref:Uncharacterized protein n=1 Tax=Ophiocordyceps australis TaxID=1399860 RepID=A0A2C5ZSQ6_9HYPO|nr:hypothetical protein CDD82_4498 [Ophiocordyceps australis]